MPTVNDKGRHPNTGRSRKRTLQRIYRSVEAQDFSQLRQIIQDVAHESPQTRHDILMKATEVIRQLAQEYNLLLTEHQAVSIPGSSTTGTATQLDPGFYMPQSVPQFPAESAFVDQGHQPQMMPMHMHWPDVRNTTAHQDDASSRLLSERVMLSIDDM